MTKDYSKEANFLILKTNTTKAISAYHPWGNADRPTIEMEPSHLTISNAFALGPQTRCICNRNTRMYQVDGDSTYGLINGPTRPACVEL